VIRVFPRRTKWTPTDELAFVGDPPLFRPAEQPVRISVTFTWDKIEGERLRRAWLAHYSDVQVGGPAHNDPGDGFTPGQFVKEGVVITSRGCPKRCPFCFVPKREGTIRELPIKDGWIVCDNNLLACSDGHIERVFEMLRRQPKPIAFKGGLDASLFTEKHAELMESIRLNEIWFACDRAGGLKELRRIVELVDEIPIYKRRCFVLIGFEDKSPAEAAARCQSVYDMGFLPFAQLYRNEQPIKYSDEWKKLARKWSRPAAYRGRRADR
jgi:hypothetical protein